MTAVRSTARKQLASLIANCPSFQTWVGAVATDDETVAEVAYGYIKHVRNNAPSGKFALVSVAQGIFRRYGTGKDGMPSKLLGHVAFEMPVATANLTDDAAALDALADVTDAIMQEALALAGQGADPIIGSNAMTYAPIKTAAVIEGPIRTEPRIARAGASADVCYEVWECDWDLGGDDD